MNDLTPKEVTGEMVSHGDPMVTMIERVLLNPDLPMERVSAAMDLMERQLDKSAEQAFNKAFAAAMAEMPNIPKSGKNTHSKQSYSTLDDLIKTTRPVLSRHGLSLNWQQGEKDGRIFITAIVRHELGHKIETTQSGVRDSGKAMNTLQGGGSTETYLKRYTGFAILGLSSGDENDDDGRSSESMNPISEAQYQELIELLDQAGLDERIVCDAEKVDILPSLPQSKFNHVRGMLKQNIKKLAS